MKILKIIIGIWLFLLSLGFLYWMDWMLKINAWIKRYVLSDKWLLFHRRKIGLLFLFLALIALYMGLSSK